MHTLAEQLSSAFKVFGALVAGAFLVTAVAHGICWGWLRPELVRSQRAVRAESAAVAAMIDQENGLRGYLLTRDLRFLEPYATGEITLARSNLELAELVGSVPELAAAMLRTRLGEERWRERWAKPALDTRPGAVTPSLYEGKALFDAYRGEQTKFATALNLRRERLARNEQDFIAIRVLLELLVFATIFLLALRQHKALSNGIVIPVAALLQHIRHIRDGKFEATADRGGPRELAELAAGLNELVGSISVAQQFAVMRDDTLREHSQRLRQILDASREFSESLNLKYVVGAVRKSTAAVGGYSRVIVWLMDDHQKRLVDADTDSSAAVGPSDAPLEALGLAGRAAESGRVTFEGPAGEVRFGDNSTGPICAIAIPLIVGARVVGALEARHAQAQVATREVVEILEMLATHSATAIESARLHEIVEERSELDALTRLFNRRRLDEDLDAECKRCLRYARPLAFVMLDVDHFKRFNDTHGHPQADVALQELAEVITSSVRATDTAYRYGGEEFCILLRETSAAEAMLFAERVRQRIEQRFASGERAGITASFGVGEFSPDSPTPRALVEAGDAAMYESKRGGRNRVALSSMPRSSSRLSPASVDAPIQSKQLMP